MSYFRHAAQGLEEKKQILYLLGPVGGGKSSLAEKLKQLMEKMPFYAIKGSPVFESPLGLFDPRARTAPSSKRITASRGATCQTIMSPWAVKRLHEFDGDISQFRVVKLYPSILDQIAIAKTEPGDENNQDISSLVGKVDIRKLEDYPQNDPDAYSYSGGAVPRQPGPDGIRRDVQGADQGAAPAADRHPGRQLQRHRRLRRDSRSTASCSRTRTNRNGTAFRNNKNNEAFLDRIYIVKVPYCLRVTDEIKIYDKLLANSSLSAGAVRARHAEDAGAVLGAVAPQGAGELEHLFEDARLRRREPQGHRPQGQVDPGIPRLRRRRRGHERACRPASPSRSCRRCSTSTPPRSPPTRCTCSTCWNSRSSRSSSRRRSRERYLRFLKEYLAPRYVEFIGKEIQTAYLESYSEYGQNIFDRYVTYADFWIQDQEYRDPETGEILDRAALNDELEKIEKPAGISNPKDFRNEIVNFVLRARANNNGKNPGLDQLREAARGDREEDVLQHRGSAAGDLLQRQGQRTTTRRSTRTSSTAWSSGLHRETGAPAVRVVPAGTQVAVTQPQPRSVQAQATGRVSRVSAPLARQSAAAAWRTP